MPVRSRDGHTSVSVAVTIERLDGLGDGVARIGDLEVTVPFTIPGERVRVLCGRRDGRRVSARLLEVLSASPHRVSPACRHFGLAATPGPGACGGCSWQHIAYPEQLRLKTAFVERLVRAALRHAPGVAATRPCTPLDAPFGYRNKVHFAFAQHGPRLLMGHYARGTRRVIPVDECPVHDPRGNALAFALVRTFAAARVEAADGGRGMLRGVTIRAGANTEELMATLVVSDDSDRRLRTATRRALDRAPEPPTALHVNLHRREDGFLFGPETRRIHGAARMREQVAGASFVISPTAFFQTSIKGAEQLVQLVLAAIPVGSRVLDLYAGAGLFALPLAARGDSVTAVEDNHAAVRDGEASMRLNRIPANRCRFIARSVAAGLPSPWPVDAVVLDPPRDGCSPDVLDRVFGTIRPPRAVYVSCNPEALARDLVAAVRHGYRIRSLQPIDMFPHTPHVETVAVLTL